MANQLASETSPYLLQHKDNPVDWLPWGEQATRLARERDVPILLSVGYSACHWCHVMERESFEDAEIAAQMNSGFVCVKVDREERPDVDALYMEAVQSMTGHGGWPMTVFLDPDGVPFYGGTYFPPEPRGGMPSFPMVMEAVLEAWNERRGEIGERAERTRERLAAIADLAPADELDATLLADAKRSILTQLDRQHGGFGGAPKFPPASTIDLLLAWGEHDACELTLDSMAAGGIYDQLAGGFARYSVDAVWLVPHFEKMLYDNALLARSYLRGWQELGHDRYRRVCAETLDWALEEMRGPEGAFYSALDADSEGEEGRFYVWGDAELRETLSGVGLTEPAIDEVAAYLGVTPGGNFEGRRNVLHLRDGATAREPESWPKARQALLDRRAQRVRPGLDDKRLTAWNALMISALAEAGAALGEDRYLEAAAGAADFIWDQMRTPDGRLLRSFNRDQARIPAFLEDHAYLLEAFVALHEASFDRVWVERARMLAATLLDDFADPDGHGFFTTAADHDQLIARRKDIDDHPTPSGNASAARALLRLGALDGERRYIEAAERTLRMLAEPAARHPQALSYLLGSLDFHLEPSRELALVWPAGAGRTTAADLEQVARRRYRPRLVLSGGPAGSEIPELLRDRGAQEGPAAYLCEAFSCRSPVSDPAELEALLDAERGG